VVTLWIDGAVLLDEAEHNQEVQDDTLIESSLHSDVQSGSTSDEQCVHTTQDPCIWDSNEIQVLRGVFKATKDENACLRSQV